MAVSTYDLHKVSIGMKRSYARRLVSTLGGSAGQIVNAVPTYHFDFTLDAAPMFGIEKPKVWQDWYRLVVHYPAVDRTLLFALAITMESRQRG